MKMPETEHPNPTLETCLALAGATHGLGLRIIEEARDHVASIAEDQDRHREVFQRVREYNEKFEEFRRAFDAMNREQGAGPGDAAGQEALVGALERLAACNREMAEIIESIKAHTGKRLGVLSKARGIFEKFIKIPAGQPPRFFDKKG